MSINNDTNNHSESSDSEDFASRTEQKKAVQEFRSLGEQLVKLNQEKLNQIPLSDELAHAIDTAKRIKSHNALKRQFQFIAKLIRKDNVEAIQSTLAKFQQQDNLDPAYTKKAEQWRDRLINEGNSALSEFINKHPESNRQRLGQLLRAATKEHNSIQVVLSENVDNSNKAKEKITNKHKRALFKELKAIIS